MNQVAINDIGTAEDFMKAIDESVKSIKVGGMVVGHVIQIDREGILLDIGYKAEAFIPIEELSYKKNIDPLDFVKIGDTINALVIKDQSENGQFILSIKNGETQKLWDLLESLYKSSDPIKGKITKSVKGGLIVDIGVRAFLPGSQIDITRIDDFTGYIGQELEFIIIEFNKDKKNVVLSRRALLQKTEKEDMLIEFMKMKIGQVHKGIVSGIEKYGAFVQIGLISGLVHISKMNKNDLQIGQEILVEIIDMDLEKSRLSLASKG
jgi:small subunit ribosomal protein S1